MLLTVAFVGVIPPSQRLPALAKRESVPCTTVGLDWAYGFMGSQTSIYCLVWVRLE